MSLLAVASLRVPVCPRELSFSKCVSVCFSSSLSIPSTTLSTIPSVYCGRGDKKTKRGKRFNHSYGNARPRNKNKGRGPPALPVPPSAPRKDKFDDTEKVEIEIAESFST